ncbi:MAG: hypothetical protein Q9163_004462 [Psora crenata]
MDSRRISGSRRVDELWESTQREQREAAEADFEARRRRGLEEELANVRAFPSLSSLSADVSTQYVRSESASTNNAPQDDIDTPGLGGEHEATAPWPRLGLAVPDLSYRGRNVNPTETIRELCEDIEQQKGYIATLEDEMDGKRKEVERLQHERHAAVEEQKNAILSSHRDRVVSLEVKIKDLARMVEVSSEREAFLERQIAEGRVREQTLDKLLHDARMDVQRHQSEFTAAQEGNERLRRQLNDAQALGIKFSECVTEGRYQQNGMQQARSVNGNHVVLGACEDEVYYEPPIRHVSGRSKRQDRAMQKNGYASFPREGGRRGIVTFRSRIPV